jgi:hypothetical protein
MNSANQKSKFCIFCGKEIPINAKKCSHCFEWLEDDVSSPIPPSDGKIGENQNYNRNTNVTPPSNNTYEESKIIPIRRFFLLMMLTCGLYSIYWYYKNSCYLRDEFGRDISVGLRTIAFAIIPIANILVFYELLRDMKEIIEAKGVEVYSPGINTLIFYFVPFFGLWVYINVQETFNEFWRVHEPHLPVRRDFNNGEILAMILLFIITFVIIFLLLVVIAFLFSTPYYY